MAMLNYQRVSGFFNDFLMCFNMISDLRLAPAGFRVPKWSFMILLLGWGKTCLLGHVWTGFLNRYSYILQIYVIVYIYVSISIIYSRVVNDICTWAIGPSAPICAMIHEEHINRDAGLSGDSHHPERGFEPSKNIKHMGVIIRKRCACDMTKKNGKALQRFGIWKDVLTYKRGEKYSWW